MFYLFIANESMAAQLRHRMKTEDLVMGLTWGLYIDSLGKNGCWHEAAEAAVAVQSPRRL